MALPHLQRGHEPVEDIEQFIRAHTVSSSQLLLSTHEREVDLPYERVELLHRSSTTVQVGDLIIWNKNLG